MGIKNLTVILNQKCKSAINTRHLDNYSGMILGIDLSIFLYKYLYNNNDHIEGLTRLILRLLKNNITPLFVFDGKPPKEKDETLLVRKEKRNILNNKKKIIDFCINIENENDNYEQFKKKIVEYSETENIDIVEEEEMKKIFDKSKSDLEEESTNISKKIVYVTSYHTETSKKLFDLFGIRYIHEECEAETLLAVLCKKNMIDACISEDTDILANGGYLFLRNFNSDKNTIEEYCLEGILNNLQLTHDEFIDMCILCGCDYTPKINGMGPITAHKLIMKYKSIEKCIENNHKFIIPENFDYVKARELFKEPICHSIIQNIDKNMTIHKPNIEELKIFLESSLLKEKYIKEIQENLMIYYRDIIGFHSNNIISNKETKDSNKKITDYFFKK
jgi:flap endonuclease-1